MQQDGDTPHSASPSESTLAALLAQLFRDAETLLLQELALFKAELSENASRMIGGALVILAGAGIALVGGLALVAAIILLLGYFMPLWAASAAVGAVICVMGAALVLYGRRLIARASFVPRRTWQSLRETGEWLSEELM